MSSSKSDSANNTNTFDTYSELHKHRCLVRSLIRLRLQDREKALVELNGAGRWEGWSKKNPQVSNDVLKQWRLGNRGQPGEWYD